MNVFPPKQAPIEQVLINQLPGNPLVSIIIPSYNQGRFIRDTIDSILQQNYRPIKIWVIDGASTDETIEVLESYGDISELSWVSEPDSGVVEAVNKGFARVTGDIVAIQSSDDNYLPGAIKTVVQEFHAHSDTGLIYGDTVKVDASGAELQRYRIGPWSLENLFLLKTWIPQPSCFFRRELLEVCGGWNETIPYAPDTDLWIRMAFRTQVRKIDEYLSERRIHGAQRDTQVARIYGDYSKMIKQSADIAVAPKAVQKAARAGVELFYRRYNPSGSLTKAFWHDLRAVAIYPKSFDARRFWANGVVIPLRILFSPLARTKRWLGCWLYERKQAELAIKGWFGLRWVDLCNRHEKALIGDAGDSRMVESEYTSYLTVARMFPKVGGRLAHKCFEENPLPPLTFSQVQVSTQPRLSVIIPVGGKDRLQNFLCVLNSILNQSSQDLEVVVVEHSSKPLYKDILPSGIVYLHFEMTELDAEFNKAKLLNRGVAISKAAVVMLHDADILVPLDYTKRALEKINTGFEALRPLRFLFYLSQHETAYLLANYQLKKPLEFGSVAQNSLGGSTIVTKETYFSIGGHDEEFQGWGGEDLEFLERLRTRRLFKGGFMPALHLWHPVAPKKASGHKNQSLLQKKRNVSPLERITWLQKSKVI